MKISTNGYGGRKIKEVVNIKTNDPKYTVLRIVMTGHVKQFATIKPERAVLRGKAGQTIAVRLTITPTENNDFNVIKIFAKINKFIKYKINKIETKPTPYYELIVENTKSEPGRYFDVINIQPDTSVSRLIQIRVFGDITN